MTQFHDRRVAAAYRHRPPYPPAVFDLLTDLLADEPRAVLDVGCGTGEIARTLAPAVERIDAVDVSAAMIEEGQQLPGGDHPQLRWIVGRAEEVPLHPPYGLITAGSSLHWLDWDSVLPRFHDSLTPPGLLVILWADAEPPAWAEELVDLISHYTGGANRVAGDGRALTLPPFTRVPGTPPNFDVAQEVERRGLWREMGRVTTDLASFDQSLDHYIASLHSFAPLAGNALSPRDAAAFDAAVRTLVAGYTGDARRVTLRSFAEIVWGRPSPDAGTHQERAVAHHLRNAAPCVII